MKGLHINTIKGLFCAALLTFSMLFMTTHLSIAADRIVKCQIDSDTKTTYQGKCLFLPEEKGSFTLANPADRQKRLYGDIEMVSVYIVENGVAEVSGLVKGGINSRWGTAKRSSKDKACWEGSDFKVCAW